MSQDPQTPLPAFLKESFASCAPLYNPEDMEPYRCDWSGTEGGMPLAVVRPASTDAVSRVVAACHQAGVRITVQGGRTGLAGGASPDAGDVVLSLERMNRVEHVDVHGGTMTVQAGVPLQTVCEVAEAGGWYFPLDCGARGSCHIGGNVATNAGGNRVLRYGNMRELVLGLEAVLSDGTVLTMLNQVLKNNTGLDLKHLFIGSEGTLGVVTRVVLRLFPLPARRYTALCAVSSFPAVTGLLKQARAALPTLSAFEVMWQGYAAAATNILGHKPPFDQAYPLYVLLESEGPDSPEYAAAMETLLEQAIDDGLVADAIVPHSVEQAGALWALRDAIGELLKRLHPCVAFDVGIPVSQLEGVVTELEAALSARYPNASHLFFGHLGDGNLHLATGPHEGDAFLQVEELVYAAVSRVGGSISAEHGIGRIKKPFLGYSRSPAEIAAMRAVKQALDAGRQLNDNRILD